MSNKKAVPFVGAGTALITPFKDGRVDFEAFAKIIDFQIESGIDALIVAGTTGESATLTVDEHADLTRFCVARAAGRVPVIAGTGGNCTERVVSLSKQACECGCDGLLIVTPFYNKATEQGLIKNFLAVADRTDKPIILYNVPSRTGVNIPISVYRTLAEHERIVAVKEASGNISYALRILDACSDKLAIYSGNDDMIVPEMSIGGKGVISVMSNIIPAETHEMCKAFTTGDTEKARKLQLKYSRLIEALFCELNPVPIKAAMAAKGFCHEEYRLPLCPPENASRQMLISVLREYGLVE